MLSTTGLINFRNQNSTAGYQGDYAEKEEVGSTNSFELRLYDARIGRWMTTDPYGQFHSPYLSMGNNPISRVDPDGGFSDPPGTEPLVDALSEVGIPMPRDFKPGWYGGYGNGDSVYNRGPIGSGNSLLNIIVNFKPSFEMPTRVKMISEGAIQRGVSARGMGRTILDNPVGNNVKITSQFLSQRDCKLCSRTHGGTDYGVPVETPVNATANGIVARSYYSNSYGNTVIINHGPSSLGNDTNVYTLYAHGSSRLVQSGNVSVGQPILLSGNSGNSTGPHLHYEVIVTHYRPHQKAFFGNLNLRRSPSELKGLIHN